MAGVQALDFLDKVFSALDTSTDDYRDERRSTVNPPVFRAAGFLEWIVGTLTGEAIKGGTEVAKTATEIPRSFLRPVKRI